MSEKGFAYHQLSRGLRDPLSLAWIVLLALSLTSALFTGLGSASDLLTKVTGLMVLGLALLKARVILARYLGLAAAPGWLNGGISVLVLWALIVAGLYLI
ncbi:nitric oxide reductase F protein [Sedimentitalea sp. CY04]|uniref:Nitric oxide reductase F protein n=1 Tax=Parasedimentitalea denitrificans TaxID=2211118 RepID=A0ABX0W5K4_9RHOB|nr:nitric oxide reductase F protein [Sedimentitalea sp. CY04]NIZ60094.1 nitric oxide reductase F protein [Sedimentitalea sp. CY04]